MNVIFKKIALVVTFALSALLIVSCGQQQNSQGGAVQQAPAEKIKWKLVTSWPKNFPGLGRGPETFAKYVNEMSGGRLEVTVYGAGELVPAFEVFNAVSSGSAEMGHAGSYYWKGLIPAAPIFTSIPFGMNATETNAWLQYGGGMELWRELYEPFGVIPFSGGSSGVQMAGWFKNKVESLDDMQGLKMRIPGLGGEVLKEIGGLPVTLPGNEVFTSLQSGAIDATEWVGPYNDLSFGLHKAAKYYYHSGWHEPGTILEFTVNKKAYEALPKDLQKIVEVAARAVNQDMLDEYTARNYPAMEQLINEHGIEVLPLPDDVLAALKAASAVVLQRQADENPEFAKIYKSYKEFQDKVREYHKYSEQEYYNIR